MKFAGALTLSCLFIVSVSAAHASEEELFVQTPLPSSSFSLSLLVSSLVSMLVSPVTYLAFLACSHPVPLLAIMTLVLLARCFELSLVNTLIISSLIGLTMYFFGKPVVATRKHLSRKHRVDSGRVASDSRSSSYFGHLSSTASRRSFQPPKAASVGAVGTVGAVKLTAEQHGKNGHRLRLQHNSDKQGLVDLLFIAMKLHATRVDDNDRAEMSRLIEQHENEMASSHSATSRPGYDAVSTKRGASQ